MELLSKAVLVGTLGAFYVILRTMYRLYLHPLSKFPGPRLAAISELWELYHDFWRNEGGYLFFELDNLHEKYGPIVRIRPNEIHVKDSDWMKILFTGPSEPRDRDPFVLAAIGVPNATISTGPFELHRIRRNAISPFFSPTAFSRAEEALYENVHSLLRNLDERKGEILDLRPYLYAWTTDFISSLIFQKNLGLFWQPGRAVAWFRMQWEFSRVSPLVKHAPWIVTSAIFLPLLVWKTLYPPLVPYIAVYQEILAKAEVAYFRHMSSSEKEIEERREAPRDIFDIILTSDCPPEEKYPKRLTNEAYNLLIAGGLSTAKTAQIGLYHILANSNIHHKLQAELTKAFPNKKPLPEYRKLQRLPFLTAVIKETMRIASIVIMRVPMIVRDKELLYQNVRIPAGTSISMTFAKAAKDPLIFPDPHTFLPQRWMNGTQSQSDFDSYVLPFGRGTRVCLGKQIAYAQLYVLFAGMIRGVDLELFNTTREDDVDIKGGGPLGEASRKSQGIRVLVKGAMM